MHYIIVDNLQRAHIADMRTDEQIPLKFSFSVEYIGIRRKREFEQNRTQLP